MTNCTFPRFTDQALRMESNCVSFENMGSDIYSPDQLPYTTIAVYSDIGVYYDANLAKRVIMREVRFALDH